jgi:hypothetical protein
MSGAADSSRLVYARIAGVAYVLIIVIGVVSGTLVDSKLVVAGDAGSTAQNIIANELRFRIGIIATLTMYAGVLVLSGALYVVLEKVNRNLALLGMLLRSAEAIVGIGTVLVGLAVVVLLSGAGGQTTFDAEPVHALARVLLETRSAGLDVVLFLVGLGGTVFGFLFFVSRCVPRPLAAWGILSYFSILLLSVVSILAPQSPVMLEIVLYAFGGAFELIFGVWLVLKGIDVDPIARESGVD